ncbi:J domain-containing protein [Myxococcota bacterium]|nr:J domain-containing protein [Myxococcota bacterium]MBU1429312.1 J domain-containing protein [Myxococcota bacterium]MBU1897940.1 J domain-containing protein [Myxococcota bacterium]
MDQPLSPSAINSVMRFEDPHRFLAFYDQQLCKQVAGITHHAAVAVGVEVVISLHLPGVDEPLQVMGIVRGVQAQPNQSHGLKVSLYLDPKAQAWLKAFVTGLRSALSFQPPRPTTGSLPRPTTGSLPQQPTPSIGNPLQVLIRVDGILDTGNYYEILGVEADISEADLQAHFHALTRRIHPDLFHGESASTLALVNRAYRRVNEAYSVLKSPERRRVYDQGLKESQGQRLRLSQEDMEQVARRKQRRRGETGTGDYYWRVAKATLSQARGHSDAVAPALYEAACLLRTAMAFEPENEHFRGALEQITMRLANFGY